MRFIKLGECNKKMIYPLIASLGGAIFNIILYLFQDDAEINNHPFVLGINAGLGMSLAIFPFLYINKFTKYKEEKQLENIETNNIGLNIKNKFFFKIEKYIFLILCAFLDFLQKILIFLFSYNLTNNVWIFNIIFLNAFSFMLYNHKLYKHQYLSSTIMVIFGLALNSINLKEMKSNEIPILFLSILIEIIYSLAIVLAKYAMEFRFCSPFEVTFYEGFFSLLLNIIFLIISTNIPLNDDFHYSKILKTTEYDGKKYLDNFYAYINNSNLKEILIFIVTMLGRVLFNLFSHLTIKYFTSSHVIIILIFGELALAFTGNFSWKTVFTIIVFIFEFILILIFCEIIELHFCRLEVNTKKNIRKRVLEENDVDFTMLRSLGMENEINDEITKDNDSLGIIELGIN